MKDRQLGPNGVCYREVSLYYNCSAVLYVHSLNIGKRYGNTKSHQGNCCVGRLFLACLHLEYRDGLHILMCI